MKIDNKRRLDILTRAADFIAEWEGFSAYVYKDSIGIDTFGYGSLLKMYPNTVFPISKEDAKKLLMNDLNKALDCVLENTFAALNNNQIIALCSFIYNLGCGAYKTSTLHTMINDGKDTKLAALQFLRFDMAGGKKVEGLVRRRKAEHDLFNKAVA